MSNAHLITETLMSFDDVQNATEFQQKEFRDALEALEEELNAMSEMADGIVENGVEDLKGRGFEHVADYVRQRYEDTKSGKLWFSPFAVMFNEAFDFEYAENEDVTAVTVNPQGFQDVIGIFATVMNMDDSHVKQEMVDGAFSYVGALNLSGWAEASEALGNALADVINNIASGNHAALAEKMDAVKNFGINTAGYGSLSGMKPTNEDELKEGMKPWEVKFKT